MALTQVGCTKKEDVNATEVHVTASVLWLVVDTVIPAVKNGPNDERVAELPCDELFAVVPAPENSMTTIDCPLDVAEGVQVNVVDPDDVITPHESCTPTVDVAEVVIRFQEVTELPLATDPVAAPLPA